MLEKRPIGVFDSGLGGLTVVKELVKVLPHENIVYLGDTARVPYGTRSTETIKKFSLEDANFLLKHNVKCIVIACNTSSALAGKYLKNKVKIPVFDVITPTLKYAKTISKSGKIGVIGTHGTIESGAYNVSYSKACPLLVPFIEEGEVSSHALKIVIKQYLSELKGKVDTLILGCTHYPIVGNLIQKEIGKSVVLVNPGKYIAKEVQIYLENKKLINDQNKSGYTEFFVTDLTQGFIKVAEMFLGRKIGSKVERISI